MTTSLFLGLPKEIILCIFVRTPAKDLLKWYQVCQLFKRLIDDSAELQYLIELYSFGYVAPGNPRRDLLSTEKVQLLKQHQKRWKSTSWTQVDVYPLKKRNLNGDTSTYDYCGGVYAQGSSFPGGQYTRRLDLYQIPSVNKGIPWKQWSFDDLGVDTRDFVMQPEYDLLVLLESNQTVLYPNSAGINEGEPDRTHYFTIHLRTLRTNEPHPDAARPTINYSTPSYRRTTSSFYFQIVGRYLAVQFLVTNASGSDKFKLRVWDWTTGKDVTYIEPWQPGAKTFTFLSDQLILIPCLEVVSTGGVGLLHPRTHGKMAVFTFNEPNDDNPAEGARQIATFELPDSSSPFLYLQRLSCRCDPAPGPSFRSATRHDSPKLFDLAPESRVLCLKMKSPGVIPIDEMESTLYIQFTDLIDAVTHLLEGPTDKPVLNIPWENWVKGTSWVDTDLLYTGNECYVYGQRVVSVGLDHTDDDSDLNEITAALLRRRSSLCVFDFDPIRNKREILLTESEIEIFYPKTDTVLGTWSDGPSLRNTFVEGEHAADTPFALRKTLINERLDQHYYVMLDDEHNAWGYETRCGGAGRGKELIPGGWSRGNGLVRSKSIALRPTGPIVSRLSCQTIFTTNQRLRSILNHTTMAAPTGDIGLIGLAVMGQNLILNMNDKGFTVVAYNRTTSKVDDFLQNEAKGTNIVGAYSIEELVAKLKRPRKIILLVKAGVAVDAFIEQLSPHLEQGDIIIDGGNSYYPDSIRRAKDLEAKGLLFVGSGVSGGEEGARHGPSLMPGGNEAAWPAIKEIFQKTAAQVGPDPCCDWMGPTGAGHYVKMVHNGIEYGDMQLIAEAYDILKRGLGLHEDEIAGIFEKWNKGVLDSFLIEITTNILKFKDEDGEPMVTKILDKAGQKGTGKWTAVNALDAGIPVTLIGEAVFARCLSAIKDERTRASKVLNGPVREEFRGDKQQFIDDLEQALYASKIISYTQGFMLMRQTAKELEWDLNYAGIARIWRGGCIIKSVFLNDITKAYEKNHELESLLFDDFFKKAIHNAQPGWRRVNAQATLWGIPTPAFSTALAFFDGYRSEVVSANILQAQRDYFGAHTFRVLPGKENERLPEGKDIHINWTGRGGNVSASTYIA
ncbi:6-phosphogluconate dehydrogenase, decarboxylating, partial [Rhizoctonia solani]